MEFDVTYYGYGAGLVMVGWLCGMIFSIVCNILSKGADAI